MKDLVRVRHALRLCHVFLKKFKEQGSAQLHRLRLIVHVLGIINSVLLVLGMNLERYIRVEANA